MCKVQIVLRIFRLCCHQSTVKSHLGSWNKNCERAYLHFVVEDLRLAGLRAGDEVLVEHAQDVGADIAQLLLHLAAVGADHRQLIFSALCTNTY